MTRQKPKWLKQVIILACLVAVLGWVGAGAVQPQDHSGVLEDSGFQVQTAANGHQALDRMTEQRPDVISLDLVMPKMSGLKFFKYIQKNKDRSSIPVVVVTAKDLTPEERDLLGADNAQVLQKGQYTRNQLLTQVRQLVSKVTVSKTGSENKCV